MDFEVRIELEGDAATEGEILAQAQFEQYHDAKDFIDKQLQQWNGFYSEQTLRIHVSKVKGQTEVLGVSVNDEMDVRAIFG